MKICGVFSDVGDIDVPKFEFFWTQLKTVSEKMWTPPASLPKFWWVLSEQDKVQYNRLRAFFMANTESNQRNRRLSSFTEAIEMIRSFCLRDDGNDMIRCIVCGIVWLKDGVATNTHRLAGLLSKCKSSINGSFQMMGYAETIPRRKGSDMVSDYLTLLKGDRGELRKWTLRMRKDRVQQQRQIELEDLAFDSALEKLKTIDEDEVDFWTALTPNETSFSV